MRRSNLARRQFLSSSLRVGGAAALAPSVVVATASGGARQVSEKPDREQWLDLLERVSNPVLESLSRRELRRRMPVETVPGHQEERAVGTHLEAFARLLAGLAPWLELEPSHEEAPRETAIRTRCLSWAQQA